MRGSLHIRKGGASWALVLEAGYQVDPKTGQVKRKQKFISLKAKRPGKQGGYTRNQAEDKLTELVASYNKGEFVAPAKMTLGEWLDTWFKSVETSPATRPATVARYRPVVKRYQQSSLGAMPLQRVLPSAISTHYNEMIKAGLAATTVRVHHSVLLRALRVAVKDKLLTSNPAADVDNKPKASKDVGALARSQSWTAARAFLAAADAAGSMASAFYALALDTGARLRELAGLTWADVDLGAGSITIHRSLLQGAIKAPEWGPTKTGKVREIMLTPETVDRLKTHKAKQAEVKMAHRKRYEDFGLVFAKEPATSNTPGRPIACNNLGDREFGSLIKAAGVRRIRFHDLRHTSATLALANGEPVRDVADRLGHSKTSMTLDIYAHATERKAPTTIRRVLFG